ncbi:MAG TPA: hypothetical protein VFG76_12515 [Candidatus Polarisedimenticolia bacterium]|nr:hypothetical protein [Candidatus Polarisedimenticolia bacterium]
MAALKDGRPVEAAALFESAMRIEKLKGNARRQMRYLSYFGLSTALADRPTPEAIQACEVAARQDFFNPELLLNLGRVYMMAGKTTRALATLERGAVLAPKNKAIRRELKRVDRRSRPPIPWMSRNHPLNQFLGRVRYSLATRASRRAQV